MDLHRQFSAHFATHSIAVSDVVFTTASPSTRLFSFLPSGNFTWGVRPQVQSTIVTWTAISMKQSGKYCWISSSILYKFKPYNFSVWNLSSNNFNSFLVEPSWRFLFFKVTLIFHLQVFKIKSMNKLVNCGRIYKFTYAPPSHRPHPPSPLFHHGHPLMLPNEYVNRIEVGLLRWTG